MSGSRITRMVGGTAVIPLALVAVMGAGSASAATATAPAPPKTVKGKPATVGVAREGNLGRILVDSKGRTLYLFKKDKGTKSACFGGCASAWPPLRDSAKPAAGKGLKPSKLATTARSDGKPQVTYNGHPLYRFSGDKKPGQTNGQGLNAFGGLWFVLSPAGKPITAHPAGGGGSKPSGGGSKSGGAYG